jgi:protein-S-isoprenylcysteine O-methyltransferase Ste14
MSPTASIHLGQKLFRLRSLTPVPLIAVAGFLLWRTQGAYGPGGASWDRALEVVGLGVALLGQALRFFTLGQVPEGTSGQGFALEARTLNTRGPYAFVRNPLYVGNLGIVLGLLLIAHQGWAYLLGLAFFFGEYFFIIRAEEDFLRQSFGAPYDEYCRKVRRWLPRLTPAYPGPLRLGFDVARALKKEHNPFAAWASGALLLVGFERWARGELGVRQLWLLVAAEVAVLGIFAAIKAFKRGWWLQGAAR